MTNRWLAHADQGSELSLSQPDLLSVHSYGVHVLYNTVRTISWQPQMSRNQYGARITRTERVLHTARMAEAWRERFRQQFYKLKHAEGLTQETLAERVGVSQPTIGHWLNARRTPDTLEHYEALAKGLKVTPQWMLYGIETIPSNEEDAHLITEFHELDEPDRAALMAILDSLAKRKPTTNHH